MSASHSFSVSVAKQYDVNIALLLQHFSFWYLKNKADDVQFFNGDYWVRMKAEVLCEYFPYLTKRQLRYITAKMIELKLIKKGEFNHKKNDRTKWYTLTDLSKKLLNISSDKIVTNKRKGVKKSPQNLSDKNVTNVSHKIVTQSDKIVTSIYKEEDIEKDIYSTAIGFLKKNASHELEIFEMQNKKQIDDYDRFIELFEIKVQEEEIEYTVSKLLGRLKRLKFNWKGSLSIVKSSTNNQPVIKRKRIG